jgi:hypothetical protein
MYRGHVTGMESMTRQMAASFLTKTWEAVSPGVLDETWSIDDGIDDAES